LLFASPRDAPHYVALFDELRRLGFTEGQNLIIDAVGFGLSPERMGGSRRTRGDRKHPNFGFYR